MSTWTPADRIRVGDHLHHDGRESRVVHIAHESERLRIYLANGVQINAAPWAEFVVTGSVAREVAV